MAVFSPFVPAPPLVTLALLIATATLAAPMQPTAWAQVANEVELTVHLAAIVSRQEAPTGDVTLDFTEASTRQPVASFIVEAAADKQSFQVTVPALESRSGWVASARSEGWWSSPERRTDGAFVWSGLPAGHYEVGVEDDRGNRWHHEIVEFFGYDHYNIELDAVPLVGRIERGGVNGGGHVQTESDEFVVTDLAPGTYSYCPTSGVCSTVEVVPWAESTVRE